MKAFAVLFLLVASSFAWETFNGEMACKNGQQTNYPEDWSKRSFQTPMKGDPLYQDSYESLGRIACYPDIVYSGDKSSATVEVKCRTHKSVTSLVYSYNGASPISENKFKADKSFNEILKNCCFGRWK